MWGCGRHAEAHQERATRDPNITYLSEKNKGGNCFKTKVLHNFLRKKGITHEVTKTYLTQSNGLEINLTSRSSMSSTAFDLFFNYRSFWISLKNNLWEVFFLELSRNALKRSKKSYFQQLSNDTWFVAVPNVSRVNLREYTASRHRVPWLIGKWTLKFQGERQQRNCPRRHQILPL
jgi:hypothetical protein